MNENTIMFNNDNFKSLVLESDKIVLVDFWAEWCGPCKSLTPIIDEIANEFKDKAVVGKINVDDCNEIAREYGIRSIPSLLFFHKGEVKKQVTGVVPKNNIEEILNSID